MITIIIVLGFVILLIWFLNKGATKLRYMHKLMQDVDLIGYELDGANEEIQLVIEQKCELINSFIYDDIIKHGYEASDQLKMIPLSEIITKLFFVAYKRQDVKNDAAAIAYGYVMSHTYKGILFGKLEGYNQIKSYLNVKMKKNIMEIVKEISDFIKNPTILPPISNDLI